MPQAIYHPTPPAGAARTFRSPAIPSEHERVIKETQKWVAQTFYGTLLKQVRQSPFHSDMLDGGRGGQAFGALMDQHLAEHMARGSGSKLVNAIARKIEAKRAYGKSQRPSRPKLANPVDPNLIRSIHVSPALRA
ncbi:MAG TPA: rod-binding protein [Tepidisphaeraceae bacterium]|nr:rod-binding protein [Tepidisphaeraceae bacterium]